MRHLWVPLALIGCGGGEDIETGKWLIENVALTASVVDQVVLSGEIVLQDESGLGGADAEATFIDEETGSTIATATAKIGLDLQDPGDRSEFELTSIQARLLPHNDGYLRVCVDLVIPETTYELAQSVGCVDGEEPYVTPTGGTTTGYTPPPEEPPTAAIFDPFDLELFGIGETVDLDGECTDPNQGNGTLTAVWTYTQQPGGNPVIIYTNPIEADGTTTGSWYNPPLGDYEITLTCTDDEATTGIDTRQISVIDRDLTDLDGDGFTPYSGDCNDSDVSIFPGAEEVCDQVDQDCDYEIDDRDLDGDGHIDMACTYYSGVLPVDDCDDNNAYVNPAQAEIPYNYVDEDCDGYDY